MAAQSAGDVDIYTQLCNEADQHARDFYENLKLQVAKAKNTATGNERDHHWWPTSVSRHWGRKTDGKLTKITGDGASRQFYPSKVAYIPDHNTTSSGDRSLETILGRLVETPFGRTLAKLVEIASQPISVNSPRGISAPALDERDRQNIARYVGSMIVRTPYTVGYQDDMLSGGGALGAVGMAVAVGTRAARLHQGGPDEKYFSKEDFSETRDFVLEVLFHYLPAEISNIYAHPLFLYRTRDLDQFVFSDAGYALIRSPGNEVLIACPILPNLCAIYLLGRPFHPSFPIAIQECSASQLMDVNRFMVKRAQREVYSSKIPDKIIFDLIKAELSAGLPKPSILVENMFLRPKC